MKLPPGYVPGVGVVAPSARGGFGERLLRRLGWAEGEGLGKERQGRAEAVVVVKKADTAGIGVDPAAPSVDWGDKWWEGAYAKAAASVKSDTAGRSSGAAAAASSSSSSGSEGGTDRQSSPSSSSSSSSSDDDDDPAHADRLAEAVGGTPAAAAAASSRRRRFNGDGTAATGSAAELAIAAAATSSRSTPRGGATFGGRAGKLARLRAQEAELAEAAREKLHGSSGAGAGPAAAPRPSAPAAKKAKKAAPPPAPPPPTPPPQPQLGPAPTPPPPGWWGAGRFIWAGPLGGVGAEVAAARAGAATATAAGAATATATAKPRGFSEADQAGLLDRAEAGKSSGRRGLGAKKGGSGGGGPAWEGKKTTFEEEEEEEEGGGAPSAAVALDTTAHDPAPPPSFTPLPKKWKAAVTAALHAAAKGRLARGHLAAAVGADPGALGAAVAASSRFSVDRKGRVSLATAKKKKK